MSAVQHDRSYLERTIETVRNHRDADNCWPSWANIFADEIERLWAIEDRLKVADAVARVWIDGLMDDNDLLRMCAHPLSCVRGALAGETEAHELGCKPEELEAALATS